MADAVVGEKAFVPVPMAVYIASIGGRDVVEPHRHGNGFAAVDLDQPSWVVAS
jgi:hypothetical protein